MSGIDLGHRALRPGLYVVTVTKTLRITVNGTAPTVFDESELACKALALGTLKTLTIEPDDGVAP